MVQVQETGYAGKILRVDLSTRKIAELPTLDYADRFLGGRGIAGKLYWDEVPPQVDALDPDNALILATGPLAGVPVIGGSRWYACAKSPATSPQHLSYCNLGGDWGVRLKSAGYDALVLKGRSDRPAYLLIEDGASILRNASGLWGKGAIETRETLVEQLGNSTSVVAIGPGGENRATMACLIATDDASGGGGMGAVMGSKNLKAVAVHGTRRKLHGAQPDRLKELTQHFLRIFTVPPVATAGNVALRITGSRTAKAPCYGCMGDCLRRNYRAEDGRVGKFMCQSATFYQQLAEMHYGPGYEVPFKVNKICDECGLDTMSVALALIWLMRCGRAGLITDESIGIPISRLGTVEFMETLVKSIALRRGFGDVLAEGIESAARQLGPSAVEKLMPYMSKADLPNAIDARLYPIFWLPLAMEPKPPLGHTHEMTRVILRWIQWRRGEEGGYLSNEVFRRVAARCWGSEDAADLSGTKGMAKAAKIMQDRQYAQECLVLCSFLWPMTDSEFTEDHLGDPSLESKLLSAVTGKETSEGELHRAGERVFNLYRSIFLREAHRGIADDRLPDAWHTVPLKSDMTNPELVVPGRGDEAVCRKGQVVNRQDFARMREEYYLLRGWDAASGLPTRRTLGELALGDIADNLESRGLVR